MVFGAHAEKEDTNEIAGPSGPPFCFNRKCAIGSIIKRYSYPVLLSYV